MAREGRPREIRMKIKLNCLKVDKATKSFRSIVYKAITDLTRITHEERRAKGPITETEGREDIERRRKIPAVTRVDE